MLSCPDCQESVNRAIPAAGTIMLSTGIFGIDVSKAPAIATLTVGIYIFCLLFAVNSAVHSYLIVRYSEGDKVGGGC